MGGRVCRGITELPSCDCLAVTLVRTFMQNSLEFELT